MATKDENKGLELFEEILNDFSLDPVKEDKPKELIINDPEEEEDKSEEDSPEEVQEDEPQEDIPEEDDEELSTGNLLVQELLADGILALETDDDGNLVKDYDDDYTGISAMIQETIDTKVDNSLWEYFEGLANIKVAGELSAKDFLDFVQKGGDPTEFMGLIMEEDLSDIDESDEDNQELLVREKLRIDGYSETEIDELILDYKDSGTLEKHAKPALRFLQKEQEKRRSDLLKKQELEAEKRKEQANKELENLRGQIDSMGIPKNEKSKLFDYITKPVKKDRAGNVYTQYELDNSDEKKLEMAYMQFKGGLKNIETSVSTKNNQKLLEALSKPQDRNARSSSAFESKDTIKAKNDFDKMDLSGWLNL